jgi:hypothetical protein
MEELNCKTVRQNLWDYAAQPLGDYASQPLDDYASQSMAQPEDDAIVDAIRMGAHLDLCRECDRSLADISSLRKGFRHLPVQAVPPLVATRLQVLASRERSRQLLRMDPGAWLRDKVSSAVMAFDHFLRPFAVPATGGVLASCLCFALIAHTLHLRPYLFDDDTPIGFFSEMTIDDVSPFSYPGKDVTLQVTIDADGKVADYTMAQGARPTPEEFDQIGPFLLYSTFTPAMRSGEPVSSTSVIALHHYTVRD